MVKIKVIDRENQEHGLMAPSDMGLNLMEVLKAHELPVEGICGGMALCASCHCYVKSNHDLDNPSDQEEDMLDQDLNSEDNSRLACQIRISEKINGLIVELAPDGL